MLSGPEALERYFLEARARLLDLAAILDRIDRGIAPVDPRLDRIRQALDVLKGSGPNRAELVQHVFSLPYDPAWQRPKPS